MKDGCEVVVFLDFDGVLHPRSAASSSEMFRGLGFLQDALTEIESVGIVVTSTWRQYPEDLSYAIAKFPVELSQKIVGTTPVLGDRNVREEEILQWLNSAKINPHRAVILDDEPSLFSQLIGQLFAIDGQTGLTEESVSGVRAAVIRCLDM